MKSELSQVKEFHQAFGIPVKLAPAIPGKDRVRLRKKLLSEEIKELSKATNIVEFAHELADCLVILYGTALEYGLQNHLALVFREIMNANMRKLHDGRVVTRPDGKVIKPKNFVPADVAAIMSSIGEPEEYSLDSAFETVCRCLGCDPVRAMNPKTRWRPFTTTRHIAACAAYDLNITQAPKLYMIFGKERTTMHKNMVNFRATLKVDPQARKLYATCIMAIKLNALGLDSSGVEADALRLLAKMPNFRRATYHGRRD